MEFANILDKVKFLFYVSKEKIDDFETISTIIDLTKEHSKDFILGRFFGYFISDYAIATLKWINTQNTIGIFNNIYSDLDDIRKTEIDTLVEKQLYKEL